VTEIIVQKKTVDMKREAKLQARLEKLGVNDPVCGMCGETDPRTFELDHLAGRKQDDFTNQICANDHRKMTFEQSLAPPMHPKADSLLYAIGRFLIGLADMLSEIIGKLYEFGIALIERSLPVPAGDVA
jgi:hypothetical protein